MKMDQGFWIGTSVALGVLLINPEDPLWRIGILVAMASAVLMAVLKGKWANQTDSVLTLTSEPYSEDPDIFWRKLRACTFVIFGIMVLGFVTWPSRQPGVSTDGILLDSPLESKLQYHPTPKGILTKEPDVHPNTETKEGTGRVVGTPVKNVNPPTVQPAAPLNVTATAQ